MKVILSSIKNFFSSRIKLENYYVKVNGIWARYTLSELRDRKFKRGEKIEQAFGPDVTHPSLHCKNQDCKSIINFRDYSGMCLSRESDEQMRDYECSCCGTVQYYRLISKTWVSCDAKGRHLRIAVAA